MKGVDQINKVYKKNIHEYQTNKLNHAVNDHSQTVGYATSPHIIAVLFMLSV